MPEEIIQTQLSILIIFFFGVFTEFSKSRRRFFSLIHGFFFHKKTALNKTVINLINF